MLWRKRFLILILIICFAAILCPVIYVKLYTRKYMYHDDTAKMHTMQAALILGAGIDGQNPSVYLKDRLDKGIELYNSEKVLYILISGDDGNDRDDEISVMKDYLLKYTIPAEDILIDPAGYNTFVSMSRAKEIFGLNEIIIVTQKYHISRAVFIGRKLGMQCFGAAADKSNYKHIARNTAREYFALLKAFLDISRAK